MDIARWIGGWLGRDRARARSRRRRRPTPAGAPGPDRLERRELRAADAAVDVAVLGASTADSRTVAVPIEVRGLAAGEARAVEIGVYRSADDRFDPAEDRRVGSGRVTVVGDGSAAVRATAEVDVPGGLRPTPARPFVLAVAEPDGRPDRPESSADVAGFRKRVIGVVTHGGMQDSSYPPAWAARMSDALRDLGYDAVITYTWAAESRTPGAAPKQGPRLANLVLHTSALFPPDEPVDLHLIGHSQGTVVNSQALRTLERISTPQLRAGFTRATMLDPHAATNAAPGLGSFVAGLEGRLARRLTIAYRAMAGDPMVTVPAFVDEAEVYYQRTPVELDGLDWNTNLWGQAPIVGHARYSNLTGPGMAHTGPAGVQRWYYLNVVPTLGEGGAFVDPTALEGRLVASAGDRTRGDLTRTAVASPSFVGTAPPGGTVRLLAQATPDGPFRLLDEATAGPDGSWTLAADALPRGHYRMVVRGVVPAGEGPWRALYPALPLGRLAVRPGLERLDAERLDRLGRLGTTDPPPTRRSVDGPRGLPARVPDRLLDRAAAPPETFVLPPGRERLLSRMAERLLTDLRRPPERPQGNGRAGEQRLVS